MDAGEYPEGTVKPAAKILIWLILLVLAHSVYSTEGSQFTTRSWRTHDGLPHNSVFCVTQTSDGYLWVATPGGAAWFDGTTFHPLRLIPPGNSNNVSVSLVCEGQDHSLWFSLPRYGVAQMKDGKVTWFTRTNGLPTDAIRALFSARRSLRRRWQSMLFAKDWMAHCMSPPAMV